MSLVKIILTVCVVIFIAIYGIDIRIHHEISRSSPEIHINLKADHSIKGSYSSDGAVTFRQY